MAAAALRRDPMGAAVVIAHRGASGYLPEHTQEAKVLAFAQGADYLEQDVVASRDGGLFVLHDVQLDTTTDVALRHPGRCRDDGHWYALDFDAAELRALEVGERVGAGGQAVFPRRYPPRLGRFRLHTLDDELALVAGLRRSTGRDVGVYPEIKAPRWHLEQGMDLGAKVVECLRRHGLDAPDAPVWLQCFDPLELRRLREAGCRAPMVQLIDVRPADDPAWAGVDPRSEAGLADVRGWAEAVGPWLGHVLDGVADTGLTARAHAAGLRVHPWTLRRDAMPPGWRDFDALNRALFAQLRVDGVFTDFPDLGVAARAQVAGARDGRTPQAH